MNFNLNFSSKFKKLNFDEFLKTSLFIWYISLHHVKYLDKPIKCLEIRAKMKPVWKINKIFLCIFTYIWKLDIFSTYLDFDENWFFGHFKSQISKCPNISKIFPYILASKLTPSMSNNVILYVTYYETPCIFSRPKKTKRYIFRHKKTPTSGRGSVYALYLYRSKLKA